MATPNSYTTPEILAWTKEEVAEKLESEILLTSKYCEAFIENEIDGRELLDLKAEDLTELGVRTLKHKKDVLRWIQANTAKVGMCEVELVTTHNDLSSERSMPTQVSNASQTIRPESSSLRMKVDPGPSYERIFKAPKARHLADGTSHLWGKKYLLEYKYHHQHKLLKNNEGIVKSWFLDRSQPLIDSFFTGSFRHNHELQKALKDFIKARESELSSLVFDGGSSIMRWKVDDIYLFFLEQKHYKTGKGVVLDARKKGGISKIMDVETPISRVSTEEHDAQSTRPTAEVDCPESHDVEHIEQLEIFLDIPRAESSQKRECSEADRVKSSKRLQMKKLKASVKTSDIKSGPTCSQLQTPFDLTLEAKEVVAMFTMDAAHVDDVYAYLQTFMKQKNVEAKKDRKGVVPFQKYTGLTKLEQLDMVVTYALKHVVKLVHLPRIRDDGLQDVFSENVEFM